MTQTGDDGALSARGQRAQLVAGAPFDDDSLRGALRQLCVGLTRDLSVLGAAVNLMPGGGASGVTIGSDERSERIDELQFSLGEGPCRDSHASGRPVLTPDMRTDGPRLWPAYGPAAYAAGVGAVFVFPLGVGAIRLGVLDVYADSPGSLSNEQAATASRCADLATETILDRGVLDRNGGLDRSLGAVAGHRAEIYQAQGAVMVDLGVSLSEALARLRAHAFAEDIRLIDVATGVLAGEVRLERDSP